MCLWAIICIFVFFTSLFSYRCDFYQFLNLHYYCSLSLDVSIAFFISSFIFWCIFSKIFFYYLYFFTVSFLYSSFIFSGVCFSCSFSSSRFMMEFCTDDNRFCLKKTSFRLRFIYFCSPQICKTNMVNTTNPKISCILFVRWGELLYLLYICLLNYISHRWAFTECFSTLLIISTYLTKSFLLNFWSMSFIAVVLIRFFE